MEYISTRNKEKIFSFKDVFLEGLAPDGGLFVPKKIIPYKFEELEETASPEFIKTYLKIEEIPINIEKMFESYIDCNHNINNKFYTKYLKVLASILKHQNKIENGKIEIVQLVKSPHGSGYALKNENSNFE